ncbi:sugar phosphate isomerase/epimerase family protein [Alkalibacter mobilis]|uniref:sugar phosphate isomerase/epimerase family protein n=1 Tax=Alkalibacter mobilis TaxID=2787712 RepID=UPI00189F5625|nr:sugar phosphate isomerase/epimerase [Alkalibacter mobilis]MBF7096886.1 sugar phosphate isomerase/epimerase [Alkalibacter mobilis]
MKSSIFSWFGYVMPLEERLDLIREAGFEGVSLWWEDETYPRLIEKEKMPQILRRQNLHLENIHTNYTDVNDLWSSNKELRKSTLNRYFSYIEDCNKFEIPVMVMHCTDRGSDKNLINEGLESFEKIASFAEINNIQVAVENTRDASLLDLLLENISHKSLGLCYDSSHDWLEGQTKGRLFEKWKSRVFTTHLSDNDTKEDRHWIPGDGFVDWSYIKKIVKETNLEYISMELAGSVEKFERPEDFLMKARLKSIELTGVK